MIKQIDMSDVTLLYTGNNDKDKDIMFDFKSDKTFNIRIKERTPMLCEGSNDIQQNSLFQQNHSLHRK
jgi:hypothetical protein